MADATPTIPTLSQVRSANFDHLRQAATRWRGMAERWMSAFTEVRDEAALPGGTVWEGQAADSLQARTAGDATKILAPAEQLHTAAGIAARGYDQMTAHRGGVLDAVGDAVRDGFNVGDTYAITDTRTSNNDTERAGRQKLADGHAAFIRHRVMGLVSADREIATQLDVASVGLDGFAFDPEPDGVDDAVVDDDMDRTYDGQRGQVRLLTMSIRRTNRAHTIPNIRSLEIHGLATGDRRRLASRGSGRKGRSLMLGNQF